MDVSSTSKVGKFFLATAAALGLGVASQSLADIATDFGDGEIYALYYREGADVVRTLCTPSTRDYDHSTCVLSPIRVPAGLFYQTIDQTLSAPIAGLDQSESQLIDRIGKIDAKLLELLNASPSRPDESLAPKIEAAQATLDGTDSLLDGVRDQIGRITQATTAPDAGLYLQLASLRQKESDLSALRGKQAQDLSDLRQQEILANASLFDQTTYQALNNQRNAAVTERTDAEHRLTEALTQLAGTQKAFTMLEDTTFSWVHATSDPDSFADVDALNLFKDTLNKLDLQLRTFSVTAPVGTSSLQIAVTRPGRLAQVQCQFSRNTSSSCDDLQITNPKGQNDYADNWFEVTPTDAEPHPLVFAVDTVGTWTLTYHWKCNGDAVPPVVNAPTCTLLIAP